MEAKAVIFEEPGRLILDNTILAEAEEDAVIVETVWSGISTGTERLLWEGRMPGFPGMGYPLVPGYESVGKVVDAGADQKHRIGEMVFVPGSTAYKDVRGLFGGAASMLITSGEKALNVPEGSGDEAVLLALAATACHALSLEGSQLPDLIVGNGILGRLAARLCVALGGKAPVIWENQEARRASPDGFQVIDPAEDEEARYACIMDLSGDAAILDRLITSLAPGGEIILAGFYSKPISFAFPPAFMKEARLRVSAEWQSADLIKVRDLVDSGTFSLAGLITHRTTADQASSAYDTAFNDPDCLKMVLNWKGAA